MKLCLSDVVSMSDAQVETLFASARWGDKPSCPGCSCDAVYRYASRRLWKCKGCGRQFSVTSGTLLSHHKLPLRDLLLGVWFLSSGATGMSSLQLSRIMGCQYKTAFVLAHKIRSALIQEQAAIPRLDGEVEVDGAFFGGYIERFNWVDKRTGRVHVRRRYGERRVVVVARERGGRTLTSVVRKESDALTFIYDRVSASAVVHADKAGAWDRLNNLYQMLRVGHNEGFSIKGACTNQAESYFSLLRRKHLGIHHRMSGPHLSFYAAEMAWRSDYRRRNTGELALLMLKQLLSQERSGPFVRYWQRSGQPG